MRTHDDDEECGTECEACVARIGAGQPVIIRTLVGGGEQRVCDRCDTNGTRPDGYHLPRSIRSRTVAHRCDCQPCQSRRLVGGLVVSLAAAQVSP